MCHLLSSLFSLYLDFQLIVNCCCCFVVLIDAILRNGGGAAPETNHVPPPTGWRDEDIGTSETNNASGDEKKSYTEEQRQGVLR